MRGCRSRRELLALARIPARRNWSTSIVQGSAHWHTSARCAGAMTRHAQCRITSCRPCADACCQAALQCGWCTAAQRCWPLSARSEASPAPSAAVWPVALLLRACYAAWLRALVRQRAGVCGARQVLPQPHAALRAWRAAHSVLAGGSVHRGVLPPQPARARSASCSRRAARAGMSAPRCSSAASMAATAAMSCDSSSSSCYRSCSMTGLAIHSLLQLAASVPWRARAWAAARLAQCST